MKIASVSLNHVWEDKESNVLLCEYYIKDASRNTVDLIIFPEMTLTGFSTNINNIAEDRTESKTIMQFCDFAKFYKIAIIFGVVVKDGAKALNKCIFISNMGEICGEYSKIHPFSFVGENKFFNAGRQLEIVKFKNLNIGLTICYDLRFPELYSILGKNSDVIVNIANWPKKRIDHWNTLLKARAIENQVYVIGVNRVGVDGNSLEYVESSNVYDANGDTVKGTVVENMKIVTLDKEFTREFISKFNTANDRQIEFYRENL